MIALPVVKGLIARRILVNFRADPQVVQRHLPAPFRPKLHREQALVGVCLIRLEQIRPIFCPPQFGLASENAAHRIAVVWTDENGAECEGVYIPRRDTSSVWSHLAGGRIFPGQHHLASFQVRTSQDEIEFQMLSRDRQVEVRLSGKVSGELPSSSCFASLDEASAFFQSGSKGYSVRHNAEGLDGLVLHTESWNVEALDVAQASSSFYNDQALFPMGSVLFDHALLMRNIEHEWHSTPEPLAPQASS